MILARGKLDNLKNNLKNEEKEWLEIFCAARLESESSNFAQQQLEKAKTKLSKVISSEELEKFFELTKLQEKVETYHLISHFKSIAKNKNRKKGFREILNEC